MGQTWKEIKIEYIMHTQYMIFCRKTLHHLFVVNLDIKDSLSCTLYRVPMAQGKQGKWPKKSLSGKTQGIWEFCQNTGNFVSSSCKCSDSKSKEIAIFAAKNSIFPEAG